MIRGVFALLALSVIVSSGALAQNSNVNVRVRLLHLVFPISIEGTSLQVTDLDRQEIENVSIPRGDSLVIDHKKIGREKFWILKKGDKIVRSSRAFIEIQSASPKIKISGFELPSPLVLSPHGTTVDVIGALKMDDYLEGVLAGEMPAAWPLEALKAQAIAARTYTLFEMQERAKDIYQLDGSVLDQAYTPLLKGSQKEKIREATRTFFTSASERPEELSLSFSSSNETSNVHFPVGLKAHWLSMMAGALTCELAAISPPLLLPHTTDGSSVCPPQSE